MDDSQNPEWLDQNVITEQVLSISGDPGQSGVYQYSLDEVSQIPEREPGSPGSNHDDYSPPSSLSSSQCSSPSLEPVPIPDSPLPERHRRVFRNILKDGPDAFIAPLQANIGEKQERTKSAGRWMGEIEVLIDSVIHRRIVPSREDYATQRIISWLSIEAALDLSTPLEHLQIYLRTENPQAQLNAAALWCILLQDSTQIPGWLHPDDLLETVEVMIAQPSTSPLVRELLLDTLGAIVYRLDNRVGAANIRLVWQRVRPLWKPIEGMEAWPDLSALAHPTPIGTDGSNSLIHAPNSQLDIYGSLEPNLSPPIHHWPNPSAPTVPSLVSIDGSNGLNLAPSASLAVDTSLETNLSPQSHHRPDPSAPAVPPLVSTDDSSSLSPAPSAPFATDISFKTDSSPQSQTGHTESSTKTGHTESSTDTGSHEQLQTRSTFFNTTLFAYPLALVLAYGTIGLIEWSKRSNMTQAEVTESPSLTDQPGKQFGEGDQGSNTTQAQVTASPSPSLTDQPGEQFREGDQGSNMTRAQVTASPSLTDQPGEQFGEGDQAK